MSKGRRDALESLGNIFFDQLWEEEFSQYSLMLNHTQMSRRLPVENGNYHKQTATVFKWEETQRELREKDNLSKYRIEKLNKLDFAWELPDSEWMNNFLMLNIYFNDLIRMELPPPRASVSWVSTRKLGCIADRGQREWDN